MAFPTLLDFAVLVLLKTARAQRHRVIQLHPLPNVAGLADDDSGPVIDEKMRADLCAGMNVDPGARVGPLRHEPRNERHFSFVKQMRHSLDRDRFDRRIRNDDLLVTRRSWIAFVGRVNIGPQDLAKLSQLRHEPDQDFFRLDVRRIPV